MKTIGIYGFRNTANGKWYIGQSVDVETRKVVHVANLRDGRHPNRHLQSAFTSYGGSAFEFHLIEVVEIEMLDVREKAWIAYYKSDQREFGYNQDSGGRRSKRHSEETKQKISAANKGKPSQLKGRPLSEEARANVSKALTGRVRSAAERAAISASKKGKAPSPKQMEHIKNMAKANIGKARPKSPEQRAKISATKRAMRNGGQYELPLGL